MDELLVRPLHLELQYWLFTRLEWMNSLKAFPTTRTAEGAVGAVGAAGPGAVAPVEPVGCSVMVRFCPVRSDRGAQRLGVGPDGSGGGIAVDLGAGPGYQSLALADLGYDGQGGHLMFPETVAPFDTGSGSRATPDA